MWFWKIFVISFSLASIWLDRGGCAPYNYFDVEDIEDNTDVRRPWSKSGSQKTRLVRDVSEAKSTNNLPTRGLFYPDDMFFTNWVPNVSITEECSNSSGTTPSCSILKSTLKTKNNDKSTKHQTTLGQQKFTSAVKSSLRHQHTSTSGVLRSSSREKTSTSGVLSSSSSREQTSTSGVLSSSSSREQTSTSGVLSSSSSREQTSTSGVLSSSIREKTTTFAVPNSSRGQKTSTFSALSSSTEEQMSTSDVQSSTSHLQTSSFARPSLPRRQKTSTFVAPSLPRRRKQSTIAVTSLSRYHKMVTFFVPISPIGYPKSRFDGRGTTSSPGNYDFLVESSTSGQRKYSLYNSSRHRRKYTFDVDNSSSGHRKPTRSPATTMADHTTDLGYFSYSEERR